MTHIHPCFSDKSLMVGHHSLISIRSFIFLFLTLVCLAVPPGSILAQTAMTQPLGGGLSLISGTGTNILVHKADNGDVMIIDGGLAQYADQTMAAINAETGNGDITLLVNTHWHPEQTGLNERLGTKGTAIFAHENTRQWLTTKVTYPWDNKVFAALPSTAQPSETFYHYGDLDHAGTPVLHGYLRQAHTDGDMYVYFPGQNVLHGGGVLANDHWPLMDWWTGGWIGGLVNGLEVLLEVANDNTVIVPASGPLMSKTDLQAMRDMYDTIFQRINAGFRAANSVEDTLADQPTAEFNARFGDAEAFVRRSHESLIPHFTPDA